MLIRDNGLFADSYLPIADLDPRMANAALDALRDAGIAAYAKASPGIPGPYLDVHLPVRPSDRLFVDTAAASSARSVLAGLLPGEHGWVPVDESGEATQVPAELVGATGWRGSGEPDLDQAWEQIVAGFDAPTEPVPRWPAEEDVIPGGEPADEQDGGGRDGRVIRRVDTGDGPGPAPQEDEDDGTGTGADPAAADEGHYIPPEPPPLPEVEPITRIAWIGLLGGPALLVVAAVLGWELAGPIAFLAVGAFVAGFGTLVTRMKDRPPTDLGGDDGAVL
ncbi:MAG TPA: hypothetical protein VHO00_04020 [Actinomycetes bacterium]|jgi:hypothetical protein|nr:hypothetical protein [Actinomycetes bacterium]